MSGIYSNCCIRGNRCDDCLMIRYLLISGTLFNNSILISDNYIRQLFLIHVVNCDCKLNLLAELVIAGHFRRILFRIYLITSYYQSTFNSLNRVVLFQRALIQRVGESIFALTDQRLRAGDVVCRAFAFHKAVSADCYIGLGILYKRRAIVLLITIC